MDDVVTAQQNQLLRQSSFDSALRLPWLIAAMVMVAVMPVAVVELVGAVDELRLYDGASLTYDAPHDVAPDQAIESVGLVPAVDSEGAVAPVGGASGQLYDPVFSFVAPGSTPTVRHYTTTEAAEAIAKGGEILPGPSSGRIWVTPDEYVDAATAQSRLALPNAHDGYFEFPLCRVDCPSPPSIVEPWNGYPGGGIEITTTSPIDVSDIPTVPFGAR